MAHRQYPGELTDVRPRPYVASDRVSRPKELAEIIDDVAEAHTSGG